MAVRSETLRSRGASARPRARVRGLKALKVALGIAVGLGGAEVLFRVRDGGAFPHLNVYAADPALAVRLRPGATEKVAFNGNPPSYVRINSDGLRGAELSPPIDGEVLVIGDSQVFGLGVEEDQTFGARLSAIAGRPVVSAGVPTYGPLEYQAIAEELVPKRRPKVVVYAVNFVNDLFEATRPNLERHVEWDGWAVRKETAPTAITRFPGRALLYRDSHAFYALRRLLYAHGGDGGIDQGFRSEGTYQDLVSQSARATEEHKKSEEAARQPDRELFELAEETRKNQAELEAVLKQKYPDVLASPEGAEYERSHGSPHDIVVTERVPSEADRGPDRTLQHLVAGVEVRQRIEQQIRARVEAEAKKAEGERALMKTFEERAALQKKIEALRAAPRKVVRALSPMTPHLQKLKNLCDAHGARLVVLALPVDVAVSAEEWKKYPVQAPSFDASVVKVLVEDLVDTAESMGLAALDATPVLRGVEPGAFLDGDIHMTPKGHAAVADALAKKLLEKPPEPEAPLPLPPGRSRAPTLEEWRAADPVAIDPGCNAWTLREWARLVCRDIKGVAIWSKAATHEAMAIANGGLAVVVAPVPAGEVVSISLARASGADAVYELSRRDGVLHADRLRGVQKVAAPDATPGADAVLACAKAEELVASPDDDCARTYAGDCAKLVACTRGDPIAPSKCLPGWRHATALERCFKTCAKAGDACEVGTCKDSMGALICL